MTTSPAIPRRRPSTKKDPVTAYALDVLRGKVPACKLQIAACQRHLSDLDGGAARGLTWMPQLALHRIGWFSYFKHSKGEWGGQPVTLSPWQQFCVGSVFGWLRADGTRRFRTVYQEIPRKNGKSLLVSGIGIIGLIGDREPGAEIYAAATRVEQARIIFDVARRMVMQAPELREKIQVLMRNMSVDQSGSKFEPLSADAQTLDGLNPHYVLVDELHKHRNRLLLDVLDTALGSRRQPLLWIITTAGDDDPETVYAQERDYAVKVLERTIEDDSAFVFITSIDEGDRWDDPAAWRKANPNLGISVKLDDLKRQATKAKNSPASLVEFKRLRLNVRTAPADRFVNMEIWRRNTLCSPSCPAVVYRTEQAERVKGRRFYGALDLSSKVDLSGWIMLFPPLNAADRWRATARFWMPADTVAEKSDRDRVQYQRWINDGWIEPTVGNVIDHEEIRASVRADCREHEPISVAYDPWNATQLAVGLLDDRIPMVEFTQGVRSYTAPTKELEARLLADQIDHGSNPVLTWMASNLAVQRDKNENLMPTKKHSIGRIDGMTALIMAIGRSMAEDDTLYGDGRGLLILR